MKKINKMRRYVACLFAVSTLQCLGEEFTEDHWSYLFGVEYKAYESGMYDYSGINFGIEYNKGSYSHSLIFGLGEIDGEISRNRVYPDIERLLFSIF